LAWQPVGAGNSVANFGLAGAVSLRCVQERPSLAVFLTATMALAAGFALVVLRDIRGGTTFAGAILALAFIGRDRSRIPSTARARRPS
jgi:hypothetical protein